MKMRLGCVATLILLLSPATARAGDEPGMKPSTETAAAKPAGWSGINRFHVGLRPLWSPVQLYGAGVIDLGLEHNGRSGFLIGFELPLSYVYPYPFPFFTARLRLGYTSEAFAVGAGLSSGYPWFWPQLGPFFRFGRYDRTHADLWLYWTIPYVPWPTDAGFNLVVPTTRRWGFTLRLAEEFIQAGTVHFLLGGEYRFGGEGGRGTSVITFGAGLVFPVLFPLPGPTLSVGYEKRF